MHISIADHTKKQFHAACAIRGLKMSQVVVELIEQWLRNHDDSAFSLEEGKFVTEDKVIK